MTNILVVHDGKVTQPAKCHNNFFATDIGAGDMRDFQVFPRITFGFSVYFNCINYRIIRQ